MELALLDIIVTAIAAGGIVALCGLGVAALPWREEELEASVGALSAVGELVRAGLRRPEPVPASVSASRGELVLVSGAQVPTSVPAFRR